MGSLWHPLQLALMTALWFVVVAGVVAVILYGVTLLRRSSH